MKNILSILFILSSSTVFAAAAIEYPVFTHILCPKTGISHQVCVGSGVEEAYSDTASYMKKNAALLKKNQALQAALHTVRTNHAALSGGAPTLYHPTPLTMYCIATAAGFRPIGMGPVVDFAAHRTAVDPNSLLASTNCTIVEEMAILARNIELRLAHRKTTKELEALRERFKAFMESRG